MHDEVYDDFSAGGFSPHIPAATGWMDMEGLLNTHLPAKAHKRTWVNFCLQAAAVAALLLLVAIPLQDSFFLHDFIATARTKNIKVAPARPNQQAAGGNNSQSRRSPKLPAVPVLTAGAVALPAENEQRVIALREVSPALFPVSPQKDLAGAAGDTIVPQRKTLLKKWQLLAGVGVNAVVPAASQYLVPYPAIEARYYINKRFFVAAGVAIGSPVVTDEKVLEKTVTYEQPVNEMKMYREIRQFKRAVYTDVPLMAGVNVSNRLSLATGIQFSFLQRIVSQRYTEAYDERMRPVNVFADPLIAPGSVVDEQAPEIHVPRQDVRVLAAITWKLEKWHVTGQYQYSFKQQQANLFSLKVQYCIK